jgi:ATP-dependent helicase HepA
VYELNLAVPKALQLARYLPGGYLRLLIDPEGRDLSDALAHQPLNQLAKPLKLSTSQNMVRMVRDNITSQLKQAQQQADAQLPGLRDAALSALTKARDEAYQRLVALAKVNPAIDQSELDSHQADTQLMQNALQSAGLRLDALRVIVVAE